MSQRQILEDILAPYKKPLLDALSRGPVVVSAPTGVGKSTQIPGWLPGRVLVVEPRRVACRALAARIAEQQGSSLGQHVGYRVRDEQSGDSNTRLWFATPGIVLQDPVWLRRFDVVVLDEFHERRLDTDWLLAHFLHQRFPLVVMSATLDGPRLAEHLKGTLIEVKAHRFPVTVQYVEAASALPSAAQLTERVCRVVERAVKGALQANQDRSAKDVLVFLPGKREISDIAQVLGCRHDIELVVMHGSLDLKEQARAFIQCERVKVVLATNVAETSLTIPGIGVVVDAGLVRRTEYHSGRGHLSLRPIAADSVSQRTGRAGRTAPGQCFRLWGAAAQLEARTPPEVHRESLVPWVLWGGAAQDPIPESLFYDPPKSYALDAARAELSALGALTDSFRLTRVGEEMLRLPLDPWYGRLLVEAKQRATLPDVIDLVAALSTAPAVALAGRDELSAGSPCDALALVNQMRASGSSPDAARSTAPARLARQRLRRTFGVTIEQVEADREAMLETIVRADPSAAYVRRERGRQVVWANGREELELARDSFAWNEVATQAIVVLATHAVASGRKRVRIATRASSVTLKQLARWGVGEDQIGQVSYKQRRLVVEVQRIHAGRVLERGEQIPNGALARAAVAALILQGRLFKSALQESQRRLEQRALAAALARAAGLADGLSRVESPPAFQVWLERRLLEIGLESGDDIALLSEADFLVEALPPSDAVLLDADYPASIDLGDCLYRARYDVSARQVLLEIARGKRATPPPLGFLPRFPGFRVCAEAGGRIHTLRERARR